MFAVTKRLGVPGLLWFTKRIVKSLPPVARLFALACLIPLSPPMGLNAQDQGVFREFVSQKGQKIKARVESLQNGQVTIVREDGQRFTFPVAVLSPADQTWLSQWKPGAAQAQAAPPPANANPGANASVTVEQINTALGKDLFEGESLFSLEVAPVAERLEWERESDTKYTSSYRAYPGTDYRFLNARPYSAAIYGEEGKVASVSLVYANKGDFFGASGRAEEHFAKEQQIGGEDGLRAAMEKEAKAIEASLTKVLGEPLRQKFGEGESRRNVSRWDWKGHSFLLASVEKEYVGLQIVPTSLADNRGRASRVSDAQVRERTKGSLDKRANGDVYIANIPMVDQGPKGYCAPATCERVMRWMGMSADMYLLAMIGETDLGGGTSLQVLFGNVGRDIKRKGRSFESFSGELKLRTVKKYIDQGIPIIWGMSSTGDFNDIANARTSQRKEISDWTAWAQQLETEVKGRKLSPQRDRSHATLIVGYNEKTNELCFSDSWGERYLERWVRLEEAEMISQGYFYVVDF